MIRPVNNHILIEPLKHESFISSEKGTYEEVGVIKAVPKGILDEDLIGQKAFFDSWLCAKYPKNDKEFFWLVRWEDVRAIENNETN